MKIYTRTGDDGTTGVIGGRVAKDDPRVEAYGTVDEVNAFVGQAIALLDRDRYRDLIEMLMAIQHELFDTGADLALLAKKEGMGYRVHKGMVERLERWIDGFDQEVPPIRRFILPGGNPGSAALHVARVLTRRAERRVVRLAAEQEINPEVRRYLNRLSDFFFVAARVVNARAGIADVEYVRGGDVFR
ncbi:cob(I)yrinic acid a,c-diamide adenosyltransferase [Bacillaceae bacterium]